MRAAALLVVAGCYSYPTMARARIERPGHVELWVAPEAAIVATPGGDGKEAGASSRPVVEGGVRYGLSDHFELDARAGTFGLGAGARIQLLRAPTPSSGIDIALAPAIEYTLPDKPAIELPVQLGINLRDRDQLVLAARVVYQQHYGVGGVSGPVSFAYAGASIGYAWQVTRCVALMPEVSLLTQIYAEPGFTSSLPDAIGIEAGLGVLWDH